MHFKTYSGAAKRAAFERAERLQTLYPAKAAMSLICDELRRAYAHYAE
jgi:hypothetical protein